MSSSSENISIGSVKAELNQLTESLKTIANAGINGGGQLQGRDVAIVDITEGLIADLGRHITQLQKDIGTPATNQLQVDFDRLEAIKAVALSPQVEICLEALDYLEHPEKPFPAKRIAEISAVSAPIISGRQAEVKRGAEAEEPPVELVYEPEEEPPPLRREDLGHYIPWTREDLENVEKLEKEEKERENLPPEQR